MANIENLNVELKKLSEIMVRMKPWVEKGLLDHRILESQFSEQQERNNKLKLQNDQAEETVKKTIQSADMIMAEARKDEQKTRAETQILWTKATAKFKEIEARIDEADRRVIRGMLKEMEKVA